jgi:transcriptional regulator with XRE-family HTH domain
VIAARKRLGWTREALAFHSGISWSGIAQIESGRRRNLRPDTLSALAGALGVSIDYLVRGGPATTALLDHKALLYDSGDELVNTAGPFLEEGVDRSEAVLAVTTKENIRLLRRQLGPAGKRVDFVESAAFLTTPSSVLERFREFANAKLEDGAPWIRILGEPIWTGRSDEEIRSSISYSPPGR